MTTATLSNVLLRLINAAEAVINRPSMPNDEDNEQHRLLHIEVSEVVNKPCDGERIAGPHEILLADVLRHIAAARVFAPERAPLWCQIAGVLLPVVREDAYRAMKAAHEARPMTTTDQDYAVKPARWPA